ncbi:MAG: cobalt-precorrin-5B (C(1))-methyltransferase CbiD, partial [Lachnospiraceae bacterium]|nr:cobalt-precorrin-5B (C(1))-methyltransferase CbiD [Lachnospiraceae bacterium]
MEQFIYKNHQKLRYGYTTGSCAAAAAKAAASMLLSQTELTMVDLMTPKQIPLHLQVLEVSMGAEAVSCAIQKDSGDDPDVTNGILVYAEVSYLKDAISGEIQVEGGKGVGRVTKPGLEQPVGEAAINRVPRQMIIENVQKVCKHYGNTRGLLVRISIPEGEALAAKTFNPRLGIVGGISVLGTSGIVEPMSEQALIDTIRVEIRQKLATKKKYLLIVPGNYGIDFLAQYGHGLSLA